jgi:hypothetical protein
MPELDLFICGGEPFSEFGILDGKMAALPGGTARRLAGDGSRAAGVSGRPGPSFGRTVRGREVRPILPGRAIFLDDKIVAKPGGRLVKSAS